MFEIVAATDGITLGHRSQIKADLAAGRLSILEVAAKEKVLIEFAIVYKRERTPIPAARLFIKLIRRHLRAIERMDA